MNDANGGQAQIQISLAEQSLLGLSATGDLQIIWNGNIVDTISPGELDDLNTFETKSYIVDSNEGANTLQIVDTNTNSNIGFAIDWVEVNDWLVC